MQGKIGKFVQRVQYDRYVASLDALPETGRPPGPDDPYGGVESRDMARARQRSMAGSGAMACLRARPMDHARTIPASEFVLMGQRFLGVETYMAPECPCCGTQDADSRHARICPRSGAQVNQHQPLVHALSRTLKQACIQHGVEDGSPFTADRDLRMDVVVLPGQLREASEASFRHKGLLIDVTYADPQAAGHLRGGSATNDGSAASTSEARKSAHYASPGHVSFDERSFKLVPLAVESFGRLGVSGYELVDQLATSMVGGSGGGDVTQKGVVKERLLQIISVTTQVAISRRVHRYRLALRGRQAARARAQLQPGGSRGEVGQLPDAWGWCLD